MTSTTEGGPGYQSGEDKYCSCYNHKYAHTYSSFTLEYSSYQRYGVVSKRPAGASGSFLMSSSRTVPSQVYYRRSITLRHVALAIKIGPVRASGTDSGISGCKIYGEESEDCNRQILL